MMSTILAIIVFGCLLAIAVFGLVKSNATASKLETTRNRPVADHNTREAPVPPGSATF